MKSVPSLVVLLALAACSCAAQSALPPLPPPQAVPSPGPATNTTYQPLPILQGGVVVPLYPAGSHFLNAARAHEAEQYNMSQSVPGRINSIVNIHNPSIEVHTVERGLNTGAAVILVAGGGHNTLNVGTESADFVPFFGNYGVNTVILRSRLRRDGYNPQTDEVNDALQSIRLVRAYAKQWNIDPNKIGIMGFSAGGELVAAAAVLFDEFDKNNNDARDPLAGITSRPDFAGIIYPGPSPFAPNRTAPPIPHNVPPAFIACGGSGDRVHAVWAIEYFSAMLALSVPNIEMHIYGNGRHPGDPLPDGSHMTGGLTDRNNTPFGTWQYRFIDWFRDLGFLQKPGVETKAARDIASYINQPVAVSALAAPGRRPTEDGIVYGEADGQTLTMDYYAPKGSGVHPVAVIIHGGGYQRGDSKSGSEAYCADFLAPAGYAVFSVNYRLAPRYPYPYMVYDVERSIRFIRHNAKRWNADPNQIALVGGSAGGFLSNMVGLLNAPGYPKSNDPVERESAKVQAVVTLYAQSSFATVPLNRDVHALLDSLIQQQGERAALQQASPITHVTRNAPPFLLIQGDKDEYIPFSEDTNLQTALREVGVRCDLIRIPGGTHGTGSWHKLPDVPPWEHEMVEWLNARFDLSGPIGEGIRERVSK